jgi:predicted ATP-grasp superfamily ATP-dependent carboligase
VFNVDSDRNAPAFFSRYSRGKFIRDLENAGPESWAMWLVDAARRVGRRPILIPTSDRAALFVAEHAELLSRWYIFPAQNPATVRSLSSKKELCQIARELRIAAPKTVFPQTRSELLRCGEPLPFPIMIKGIEDQLWAPGSGNKVIVRTREELAGLCGQLGDQSIRNLIVQEYIPGGAERIWMFNGYFNERSECLAGLTGTKLRQHPAHTGITSLGICRRNEAVEETARKLMKAVGYRGIVDMGFCYDERDGQYKILDVNPRIGCTFRLFVSGDGLDVARALYLDLTGQPFEAGPAPDGRKWIVEDLDLASSFRYHSEGTLTVMEWARSFRGVQEAALFAVDDPLPALKMWRAHAGKILQRTNPGAKPALAFVEKESAASAA